MVDAFEHRSHHPDHAHEEGARRLLPRLAGVAMKMGGDGGGADADADATAVADTDE